MKKLTVISILLVICVVAKAQNIQLHYDLGKERKFLTSTVEMLKPDKYGSTFMFIDMDYNSGDSKGVSRAYWEISRAFKFWKPPVAFRIEYNGGMGKFKSNNTLLAFSINSSWLTGIQYSFTSKDFTRGLTIQANFKSIRDKNEVSFQITEVWFLHLFNKKFSFNGYADFWREDNSFKTSATETVKTKFKFLSEPQFWYNFSKNFSAGSEEEISFNFAGKGWVINPTLAVKYTF
jgi:hypothetical protein